ncbi:uncharacterized protein LOC122314454 [Carya illinoinensis]|uniref:DUF4378 domain-containing protein n=1 Tax=Carya illinoinensis TaxID=32201 RepID=A0A8T1QD44_CARIL|nr:uncharacterized protein LOC122314454 [Carya illinoinensis]KAG6652154.1 hypothetical protein CIPAW_06G164000 [Carya illinoinensis]
MASYASKPAPAKKLRQHLQDQQDPSNLDIYLSERSWYMKSWRSLGCDCNKGIKGISYVTRILASAIYKFIPTNNSQELSNEIVSPARRKTHLIAEKRVIFSTKCLNACISADYSNIEENCLRSKRNRGGTHASPATAFEFGKSNRVEATADTILQWISMEESMQLSTTSVLREAPSNEEGDFKTKKALSSYTSIPSIRDVGDSIVSVSLLQLLKNSSIEKRSHVSFAKPKGLTSKGSSESSQCLRCKRLLQQRKQLLFDSEKEALETHGRNEKKEHTQGISDTEDMEIMICEHICSWGKQAGGFTNKLTHQMNFDFSKTLEEWCDFHQLKREIGMKIGDAIMEEIVREMIDFFYFCSK